MIRDKKILIFGGSGSLGNALTERYIENNHIINYSRDESKQWDMSIKFSSNKKNLTHVIGDIRDRSRVSDTLLLHKPNYIIIAAALKHIDKCETNTHECIQTNLIGIQNILDSIKLQKDENLECVCFISTDKACSPVNIYGMCKAASEKLVQECAFFYKKPKFVIVRYGNVLNSRGSIIPFLHRIGKDESECFTLTDSNMTRFIMTLDESVDLIEFALLTAPSGHISIPIIKSMKIIDLFEIFSDIYNKKIKIIGLRPGEKMYESLINDTQAKRTVKLSEKYYCILPDFVTPKDQTEIINQEFDSNMNLLNKETLKQLLIDNNLI